ncbi:hypothetical protein PTKIN_Ptkin19aG0127200 [Pterospermum kingtungense]
MPILFKFKPKSSPHLRIADVLLLRDDEEQTQLLDLMDGSGGFNRTAPRRIADCFFSCLKRGKMKRNRENVDDGDVAPSHVTDFPDSLSERLRREADFNVGVGCCLVNLIVESKNELQKLTELRIQMESVLQKVKEELKNNDLLVVKKLESNDGVEEGLGFNNNLSSNKVLFDRSLKFNDVPKQEDCLEGMDRLEAELEVELERLQFHLDTGKISTNHPQETIEESTVNSVTSARSNSISCGEVIDPTIDGQEDDFSDSHSGVPPYELERKLHELLETRQEQQIRELEAALVCARQEIREKEREISWWKDTALLMSRHANEPSRLNFQLGQHTYHLR